MGLAKITPCMVVGFDLPNWPGLLDCFNSNKAISKTTQKPR